MNRLHDTPGPEPTAAAATVGTRPLPVDVAPPPAGAQRACARCRQNGLDGCTDPGGWQCSRCRWPGCTCDHSRCDDGFVEVVAGRPIPNGNGRLASGDGSARCPSCVRPERKGAGIIRPGGRVT